MFYRTCKYCQNQFTTYKINQKCCTKQCAKNNNFITWSFARKQRGLLRKQQLIESMGGGCVRCGYNKSTRALCFHHIDESTKTFTLDQSNLYKYTFDVLINESKKCILLCQNCHQEHHEMIDNENSINSNKNSISKRQYYLKNKLKAIEELGGKCSKCSYRHPNLISSMTFHHVNSSTKTMELNAITFRKGYGIAVQKELKQCILLCFNCHMSIEDDTKQ